MHSATPSGYGLSLLAALVLLVCLARAIQAQPLLSEPSFGYLEAPASDHITEDLRAEIEAELAVNIERLATQGRLPQAFGASPRFGWPLRAAASYMHAGHHGISNFFDHDSAFPNQLRDYMCGARTYDTADGYNHQGIDFFTWPFAWYLMDNDLVEVVAVAPGVIVGRHDGHADRNCSFTGGMWNAVYVRHADGTTVWYGHLKRNSVTAKQVGDTVEAGEYLGVVGSSGNSTGPHLHLEVYSPDGRLIDPYAGECNPTTEVSLWEQQRSYYDSAINAVMTHSATPQFPSCPQQEVVNRKNHFTPGEPITLAVYLRDQRRGQPGTVTLTAPSGTVASQGTFQLSDQHPAHYAASYWLWSWSNTADAEQGTWTGTAEFEGSAVSHAFTIGQGASTEDVAPRASRVTAVFPNPMTDRAQLTLTADRSQHVRAVVYDLLGRELAVVFAGEVVGGVEERIEVRRGGLAAGLYVIRVEGESFTSNARMTILR